MCASESLHYENTRAHSFNSKHSKCLPGPQREVFDQSYDGSAVLWCSGGKLQGGLILQTHRSISLTDSCLYAKGEVPIILCYRTHTHLTDTYSVSPVYIKPSSWIIKSPSCGCEMLVTDCSGASDLLQPLYRSLKSLLAVMGLV